MGLKVLLRSKFNDKFVTKTLPFQLIRSGCTCFGHWSELWLPLNENIELENVGFSRPPLQIYVPVTKLLFSDCDVIFWTRQENKPENKKSFALWLCRHSESEWVQFSVQLSFSSKAASSSSYACFFFTILNGLLSFVIENLIVTLVLPIWAEDFKIRSNVKFSLSEKLIYSFSIQIDK